MDNSTRPNSVVLPDTLDPFRDSIASSESSTGGYDSSFDRTPSLQPAEPSLAHIRDATTRGPEQPRNLPLHGQIIVDEILAVQPVDNSAEKELSHSNLKKNSASIFALSELVTRRAIPQPLDRSARNIKAGKQKTSITKWIFVSTLVATNTIFIFITWWWSKYYYILLPFITITVGLNCIMVLSVIVHTLLHRLIHEKEEMPEGPESIVFLLPCYNETREECVKSLDSLVDQASIDEHQKSIMIVCDGHVRGPGMEKTTAAYLLEDILTGPSAGEYISEAYTAWDHTQMDVMVQSGSYGGIPYFCIIKQRNQGKRDTLLLIRSFLYNFNIRTTRPAVIFSPYFFGAMASFLSLEARFSRADVIIGMDADTFFDPACVSELLKQSHYVSTVGVCGFVAVDFQSTPWSLWCLYQNTEYTISQCLRRLHQSIATHKVSCLPGCCQLLKVSEATCGDYVLLDLFGYCPNPTDSLLKQIRATASEDRNHVCLMLSAFPKSQTRQALKARAYTGVPVSWSVFLSQRRRWTLGATSNDLFLIFARGINWFERILACANVLTWVLNFFILECIASFIKACTTVPYALILAFAAVMMCPLVYYLAITVWQPRGVKDRVRYLLGLLMYFFLGPFLNIIVLMYALWGIDDFTWGKTRKVLQIEEHSDEKWHVAQNRATSTIDPRAQHLASEGV